MNKSYVKKYFKSLLYIAVFLLSLLVFVSCHGKKDDGLANKNNLIEIPETFDTSKNYEITFWAKNDSNPTQIKIYNETIKRFQEFYPNIKVTIIDYYDYGAIYEDVIKKISTNTTPNVCITYPDFIATYIQGEDVVVPLDNFMSNSKYGLGGSEIKYESITKDQIISKFLEEGKISGYYYQLPFMRSSEATYINKDYVNKLGYEIPEVLTWDFVWEVCEKAYKEKGDKNLIPLIYKSTDNMFIQMAKQMDIDYATDKGDILLFNDDSKELLKELSIYTKNNYFETFTRTGYPANFLNRGECIFAIDSTAGSTWMGSKAPLIQIDKKTIVDFETVVKTVPQYDANNVQMISQGPSVCIFNKEDKQEVLASWLFTQFLLNSQTQMDYAKTEGYIPVTNTVIDSTAYKNYLANPSETEKDNYSVKIDASKLVIDNINNTFITPVFNGSSLVRTASGKLIELVANLRTEATDEDINNIFDKVEELYRISEYDTNEGDHSLPLTAILILVGLGIAWIGIGFVFIRRQIKEKQKIS